ncbi:hypothetical protein BJ742DRAFT_894810 [Cladochytrium replicatum]|nr:hypothetical protein BJ742DRAFT_894810 [Cladochytrium replicatum]
MLRVGILTVSDSVSAGISEDRSGPAIANLFNANPQRWTIAQERVVPDDMTAIQRVVQAWTDNSHDAYIQLIVTTGGTGFGVRDITPEALSPLFDKEAQSIATAMTVTSLAKTPFAALSRLVAGVRKRTLIIALPGSVKGATESISAVLEVLPHAIELASGNAASAHPQNISSGSNHGSGPHHHHHHAHHHAHNVTESHNLPTIAGRARNSTYPMLSLTDAETLIRKFATILEPIERPVDPGLIGYVLAEDVISNEPVPAFRASIVDGYAVIASDGPGEYPVVGSTTAGEASSTTGATVGTLRSGEIMRVTTGAPVPNFATAVVMVEQTELVVASEDGKEERIVRILAKDVKENDNIRGIGSDVAVGEVVLRKGDLVSTVGGELGVLASIGITKVPVFKKPVVAVLSTGNEVVDFAQQPLPLGKVRDTNRITLLGILDAAHIPYIDFGSVGDSDWSAPELEKELQKALDVADVVVTSGGVSMGELDLLKPTIVKLGGEIHFGRVALKPGKPTTFATFPSRSNTPKLIFALPGNPVSANVMFHVFVIPAIRCLAGYSNPELPQVIAELGHRINLDPRPEFYRVTLETQFSGDNSSNYSGFKYVAFGTGFQRSSRMMSMRSASALLLLPAATAEVTQLQPGARVRALLF